MQQDAWQIPELMWLPILLDWELRPSVDVQVASGEFNLAQVRLLLGLVR